MLYIYLSEVARGQKVAPIQGHSSNLEYIFLNNGLVMLT